MEQGEKSKTETTNVDPDKYLKAKVTEVRFEQVYKACRSRDVIEAPHWPAGNDGYNQSKKAAVWQLGKDKSHTAKIKLEIDSKGVSGSGRLTGTLGQLVFEGETSLTNGPQEVVVTLKETPASLHWVQGKMAWVIEGGGNVAMAGATLVELFFVFDDPKERKFFKSKGVWIEALRFIFKEARLEGTQKIKDALGKVTKCCFALPQHKYEIKEGAPKFGGYSGFFRLERYMQPEEKESVNCYDQSYAVIVFGGALGIPVDGLYIKPYGFLKLTQLVGWGNCNNPFPETKYEAEKLKLFLAPSAQKTEAKPPRLEDFLVVDPRDKARQPFGNHMFCAYEGNVYDACAGPAVGRHDSRGYLSGAVDTVIPEGGERYAPASADAIVQNARHNLTDIRNIRLESRGKTYQLNTQVKAVYDEAAYKAALKANQGREPFLTTYAEVQSVK